jgi:hypothetical protein
MIRTPAPAADRGASGGDCVVNEKTLGILLYVDNSPIMLEDFSWIYKSWIYSGNWRTSDLVVVCNPLVYDRLPNESGVVKIAKEPVAVPGSRWEGYPFINSIACLTGQHTAGLASRYTHLLRTDADVFLTHNLVNFRPNIAVHGRGRYAERADVREKIVDFAARHGINHHGVFNCGHSLMAFSDHVLMFLQQQNDFCELLLEEFKYDKGEWPGWCMNVTTMYAAELVANHNWDLFLKLGYLNMLDYETVLWSNIDETNVLHIHAVNTFEAHWSKLAYRRGEYKDYDLSTLDISIVKDYCHWIHVTPVEEIKRLAGYSE